MARRLTVDDPRLRITPPECQANIQNQMSQLFRLPSSVPRDPSIDIWVKEHPGELGEIAKHWFEVMRACGDEVREVLHEGKPTACIADAAFAYVNAFKAHMNVGFFRGAEMADPDGLLEGTGKFMRHVVRPDANQRVSSLKTPRKPDTLPA